MSYTLFVSTEAPLYSSAGQDMLEAAMSAANADLSVKLLFVNDGCYQLITKSQEGSYRKDINKQLALLALYEIDDVFYYLPPNNAQQQLSDNDSAQQIHSADECNELFKHADHVLVF